MSKLPRLHSNLDSLVRWWNQSRRIRVILPLMDSLASLLEAGIPLRAALIHLRTGQLRREQHRFLSLAIDGIEGGQSLSESWAKEVPGVLQALLQAGEHSGNLSTVLRSWTEHQNRRHNFHAHLMRTLAYPIVLAGVTAGLLVFIARAVFPSFNDMYRELGLPPSDSLRTLERAMSILPWAISIFVLVAVLVAVLVSLIYHRHPRRWLTIQRFVPGFRMLMQARTSFFCELLQMLLEAGIPIADALHELANFTHPRWCRARCQEIEQKILNGQPLQVAFTSHWDPLLGWMLVWAEQTGDLQAACGRVHSGTERLLLTRLEQGMKVLEPSLLAVMGTFVGFTMYALFVPMYDLTTVISSSGVHG